MKTKTIKLGLVFLGLMAFTASCEIDNFEEPDAFFTGRITYQGEPIQVGQNQVSFELFQPSFELSGPLGVLVAPDGSYSQRLFAGDYRLAFVDGQGPFLSLQDTIRVNIPESGIELDVEVLPYYMVRSSSFSQNGNSVNATVSVEKILDDERSQDIEKVTLFLNSTQIVSNDGNRNIAASDAEDISNTGSINMSVEIPDIQPTQNYVFARVGVKVANVEDWLFSPVERIDF